jgi:hypothetical protein
VDVYYGEALWYEDSHARAVPKHQLHSVGPFSAKDIDCAVERIGRPEQPSDAQRRASHLTVERTYGLT